MAALIFIVLRRLFSVGSRQGRTASKSSSRNTEAAGQTQPTQGATSLPPLLSGFMALIAAFFCAWLAFSFYTSFRDRHPPVSVTASAQNVGTLQDLTLTDAANSNQVRWLVVGSARRLTVSGPERGMAEINLPLARSACAAMKRALGTMCTDGRVSLGSPVELTWSDPQTVSSPNGFVVSDSLDIASAADPSGVLHMVLSTRTNTIPSLCFSSPLAPAKLTLQYGSRSFHMPFSGSEGPVTCGTGISVRIGSAGKGIPPAFEFDGVDTLQLCARAPAAAFQGYSGQVTLDPGGTTGVVPFTAVSLRTSNTIRPPTADACDSSQAGPHQGLYTALGVQLAHQSLNVHAKAATSVTSNGGELVPSAWDRNSALIGVFFAALVTTFVIAPLGFFIKTFMNTLEQLLPTLLRKSQRLLGWLLKRLLDWFHRRAREGQAQKEERHAS
jgi:hypothetical protein